jgi:PAP2 superfamily
MSLIENIGKQQASPALTTRLKNLVSLFFTSIKAQSVLFAITAFYMLATYLLFRGVPGLQPYDLSLSFFIFMLPILLLSMIILRFINICVHVRPKSPIKALYYDLKDYLFNARRLSLGLPVIVVLFFFIETFAYTKVNFPVLKPFEWDIYFMELDRWMHFGYQPWEILQPVLGYPPVTFLINLNYNTWFIVMWTIFIWQAFAARPSALRLQFFISFLLLWSIGGSVFAMLFSSAGPAFYEGLNLTPNPYKDLMAYLYQVNESFPIWALNTQEMLWASYVNKQGIVAGISAMPSMHNASAILFALLGWKVSRAHGIALTIFAVLIFLGSIHLGWHYAVDGYAAAVLAVVIWWISGKIATWADKRPAATTYRALFDDEIM